MVQWAPVLLSGLFLLAPSRAAQLATGHFCVRCLWKDPVKRIYFSGYRATEWPSVVSFSSILTDKLYFTPQKHILRYQKIPLAQYLPIFIGFSFSWKLDQDFKMKYRGFGATVLNFRRRSFFSHISKAVWYKNRDLFWIKLGIYLPWVSLFLNLEIYKYE